ncbi:2-amino-4-hydroxy-6-hydroxymethyldihydropteridine diphosphokinase [Porticoccaceae bacterium LTM1]|nr:2-amino-4-hydroxy-6-hydroxymethyldihydropteridine diphosphokinase [Porticoccaceae bacterium LTM1]
MSIAYLSLGSNLDNPRQQVEEALHAIAELPATDLLKVSPWYRTKAIGPGEQPDYVNGVCAIETDLSPLELLHALQSIELSQGRERNIRWGARTLDIDILLYDDQQISSDELEVPHPRMVDRNFVLIPLADIVHGLHMPDGTTLSQLLANCPADGIVRL